MSFQPSESGILFACSSRDSFDSWFTIFTFFERGEIQESTAGFQRFGGLTGTLLIFSLFQRLLCRGILFGPDPVMFGKEFTK